MSIASSFRTKSNGFSKAAFLAAAMLAVFFTRADWRVRQVAAGAC